MKITSCKGGGQGSCKLCEDYGKWNTVWMSQLYKIEGYEGCYCADCVNVIKNSRYLSRAESIDDGEWVVGYYENSNGKSYMNYEEPIEKYGKSLRVTRSKEINFETLGQSTGLILNGKLLFEGDIVKCYYDYDDSWGNSHTIEVKGVVVWDIDNYCWSVKVSGSFVFFNEWDWNNSTVIGNIHDNAELIGVKR